jgi:hypothetical protein
MVELFPIGVDPETGYIEIFFDRKASHRKNLYWHDKGSDTSR